MGFYTSASARYQSTLNLAGCVGYDTIFMMIVSPLITHQAMRVTLGLREQTNNSGFSRSDSFLFPISAKSGRAMAPLVPLITRVLSYVSFVEYNLTHTAGYSRTKF